MNKTVGRNEIPIAKKILEDAGLYPVPNEDLDRLADVAADAYKDYPLHNWFAKGKYDPELTGAIMRISLKSIGEDALIYADSEELNGFAVWTPPGFTGTKSLPFLKNGGIKLLFTSGPGVIYRLQTYENMAMKAKKQVTENKDWYLYNLSVRQAAQGKGIASKLLRPMLELCDKEGAVAYLETNKESNVGLYCHYGFELKQTLTLPKSNVMHYSMARTPLKKD